MSLINDALKKAQEQKQSPAPVSKNPEQEVKHTNGAARFPFLPVLAGLVLAASFFAIYSSKQQESLLRSEKERQLSVKALEIAAVKGKLAESVGENAKLTKELIEKKAVFEEAVKKYEGKIGGLVSQAAILTAENGSLKENNAQKDKKIKIVSDALRDSELENMDLKDSLERTKVSPPLLSQNSQTVPNNKPSKGK